MLLLLGCSPDEANQQKESESRVETHEDMPTKMTDTIPPERSGEVSSKVSKLAKSFRAACGNKNIREAHIRMNELLSEWDPVGLEPDQVIQLLGEPYRGPMLQHYTDYANNEAILYRLGNGNTTSLWIFHTTDGKVTRVQTVKGG